MPKAGKNRLSKERRERQRRYRAHHHTATHFVRLRLPQPRVVIDGSKRWYGVRTLAYLQRRLQRKLTEAGFATWLPAMAIASGQYLPISGTILVGLDATTTPPPTDGGCHHHTPPVPPLHPPGDCNALWAWHDRELAKGMARPFHALLGPVDPAELQRFADWITGHGSADAESVFALGDSVVILAGPFANLPGIVEQTDADHCRLTASVSLFGRQTPVELPFAHVERAA